MAGGLVSCITTTRSGLEAHVDVLDAPPAPDEQTGADQQNNRQRKLSHHERATNSMRHGAARHAATRLGGRTQAEAQRHSAAGSPTEMPTSTVTRRAQPRTRNVEAYFVQTRQIVGAEVTNQGMAASASRVPIAPATAGEHHAFDEQLPHDTSALAPSAERTAISRARPTVRASDRLATLAPAISNTQNTAPPSIHSASRD